MPTARPLPSILAFAILAAAGFGQGSSAAEAHVRATLHSPKDTVAPGGSSKLTLELEIEKGWHIYPTGSTHGLPTTIDVTWPAGVTGGEPRFPATKKVTLFNEEQEVFEETIRVELPFSMGGAAVAAATSLPVECKVSWQACLNVCVEGTVTLTGAIPVAAGPAVAVNESTIKTNIQIGVGSANNSSAKENIVRGNIIKAPKPVTVGPYAGAYQVGVEMECNKSALAPGEEADITVRLTIAPGFHVYAVSSSPDGGVPMKLASDLFELVGPPGGTTPKKVKDPLLEVVNDEFELSAVIVQRVRVPTAGFAGKKPNFKLYAQACDAKGCLNPEWWIAEFEIKEATAPAATTQPPEQSNAGGADQARPAPAAGISENKQTSLGQFLVASALGGWLSLFTPCVFPMIPITVSFFSKRSKGSRRRSVGMAGTYAGGIILTFTLIGVVASLIFDATGIPNLATNKWFNLSMGLLFVVLGFSLLGLFTITAPAALTDRVEQAKSETRNDYIMTLLMAVAFTLASFTCTVPVLGGLLSLATKDPWRASAGMLSYSTAFALPFFLLALFPSMLQRMPKGGSWLETVKITMGFAEIAAALKFLSTADIAANAASELWISRPIFLVIWIALFTAITLYLFGILRMPGAEGEVGSIRAMSGVSTLAFTLYLCSGLVGGVTFGPFLDGFLPPAQYSGIVAGTNGGSIPGNGANKADGKEEDHGWDRDFDAVKERAKRNNKRIFVHFTGENCSVCRGVKNTIFPRPAVMAHLQQFEGVDMYLDITRTPEESARTTRYQEYQQKRFETTARPYYVILEPDGETVVEKFGFDGVPSEAEFLQFLERAAAKKQPGR